jgi:hypothetical protein
VAYLVVLDLRIGVCFIDLALLAHVAAVDGDHSPTTSCS